MYKLMLNLVGVLALLAGFSTSAVAGTRYVVEDLGTLPGDYESMPWGINAHGDVVGSSTGPKGQRAFLFFDRAGMIELPGVARGAMSVARDINDNGVVVGQSSFRAAVWDLSGNIAVDFGGKYLDNLDRSSEALAVNNRGGIVGWFGGNLLRGSRHAFVYTEELGMVDLTPFGDGEANDINDAGQVAGVQNGRAFVWNDGRMERPELLPEFGKSTAWGINEFAEVVGSMTTKGLNSQRIFKFSSAVGLQDLGGHGDLNVLRRINANGQSVGQGRLADGKLQALIHSDADGLLALNSLITAPGDWYVEFATDINDEGVIVASAWSTKSRTRRAVKLVPVAEDYCLDRCIRSEEIAMKAGYTRDQVWVDATVLITDENGAAVPGARVAITWSLPDGRTFEQVNATDRQGLAAFEAGGPRGAYVLKVRNVSRDGFEFDSAHSSAMVGVLKT